jgi:hypothetical protein
LEEGKRVGMVPLDDSPVVRERTLVPVPVLAVGLMVLTAGTNEPVAMDEALVPVAEETTVLKMLEATGTFVFVADLGVVEAVPVC